MSRSLAWRHRDAAVVDCMCCCSCSYRRRPPAPTRGRLKPTPCPSLRHAMPPSPGLQACALAQGRQHTRTCARTRGRHTQDPRWSSDTTLPCHALPCSCPALHCPPLSLDPTQLIVSCPSILAAVYSLIVSPRNTVHVCAVACDGRKSAMKPWENARSRLPSGRIQWS